MHNSSKKTTKASIINEGNTLSQWQFLHQIFHVTPSKPNNGTRIKNFFSLSLVSVFFKFNSENVRFFPLYQLTVKEQAKENPEKKKGEKKI